MVASPGIHAGRRDVYWLVQAGVFLDLFCLGCGCEPAGFWLYLSSFSVW